MGCKALDSFALSSGDIPQPRGFEPLWSLAQEARLPIVFHVGGEEKLSPDSFNNGLPRVKDFHGGEENFTSLSFMPIPHSVQITLRRADHRRRCRLDHRQLRRGSVPVLLGLSACRGWPQPLEALQRLPDAQQRARR